MSSELSGSSFIFDSSKTLDDSCDLHSSLKCTLNGTLAFSGMKVREDLTSCDCDDDDLDSLNSQPQGERWPPLGAPNDDNTCTGPDAEFKWLDGDAETRLDVGQERQKELIEQLKQQLEDLEYYAYQTGEAGLPQSILLQKQRVIIDQLKGKLNLKVDDFDKLTIEDLKQVVDQAVKEPSNAVFENGSEKKADTTMIDYNNI
ncbi:RUN domain-containing protein 1 [Armadillidium vulgare]|nr:RUN domain-containing protein 1 [Armadillidium vulgare]